MARISLPTCVTLGKLLNLSGLPVALDLENGAGTSTYVGALLTYTVGEEGTLCASDLISRRVLSSVTKPSQHLATISDCMMGGPDYNIYVPG